MAKTQLSIRLLLTFALAFALTMPATFFVSSVSEHDRAPDTHFPGYGAEHRAVVQIGNDVYGVWIEGEIHQTVMMFSFSQDMGMTWSPSIQITNDEFVPLTVQLSAGTSFLHLIWMDASSRHLTTCYRSMDLGNNEWNAPIIFEGENPSLATEEDTVAVATAFRSDLTIYLSRNEGQSFSTLTPMPNIVCQYPSMTLDNGQVHAACIGKSAVTGQKGIYYAHYADGQPWTETSMIVEAVAWMKEIKMDLNNDKVNVLWREVSTENIEYYSIEETSSGFGDKILISSEPVIRETYENTEEPNGRLPPKKWTFIVYLDADNNLDGAGYADMTEMEAVGSNIDLNIIVLFDGDTNSGPDTHCFYINPGSRTEIPLTELNPTWTSGELNMGDPQTAIDFAKYVYNEYPADKYVWDMWDHGGSWTWGMCSDDTSGDHLTSLEVRTIYETLRTDTGQIRLFDVAGYDQCLMADCCLYYDEMPYIDYMCNSEDSIGFDGWEYDIVLGYINADLDMNGEEAAFWIFQAYVDAYGTSGSVTTMSVINATMLATSLAPALNNFAQKAIHEISTYRSDLQSAANGAKSWQGYNHQRDLYHFCELAIASIPVGDVNVALQELRDAATANPVGTVYGHPSWQHDLTILIHNQNANEHGMKIYIASSPYNSVFDTMTLSETNWDEFYIVLWGSDANAPNLEPTVTITNPPDSGFVPMDAVTTITGTANDDGTVQRVDVAIDTEHWDAATGTISWSYDWDTTGWEPGWHTIMARSFDGQDFSPIARHDVFLLDNQPPTITLLDNNGQAEDGTWAGTEQITWLASDPNEDDALLDIKVEYSPNAGGSWFIIEDGTDNNDGFCPWDTTVTPDGTNNLLRVTVFDSQLNTSTDESDNTFTIFNLPNANVNSPNGGETFMGGAVNTISWDMGDFKDPINSLSVNLYYSTNSGASYPNTIVSGLTGFTENPCTYDWDPTPFLDTTTARVRAEVVDTDSVSCTDDSDGDFKIDSTAPQPATDVNAELTAPNNIIVTWTSSPSADIDHYEVYYKANGWDPNGDGYVYLGTSTGTSIEHVNAGITNPSSYFYQVRAFDVAGHESKTQIQAGKLGTTQSLFANPSGWFMLGSFLEQSDTSLGHVLQGQGLPANWDHAQLFDSFDAADHWKSYLKGRPDSKNDLTDIGNTEGFWLHLTNNSRWATAGRVTDLSISLKAGWNMVPYPFVQKTLSTSAIETILAANCPNFDRWEIADYDSPYLLKTPDGTENLVHGDAFWVYVTADGTWNVSYY